MRVFAAIVSCAAFFMSATSLLFAQTTAYIANSGDDTVTRVLTTGETFGSVSLGDNPYGAAVTPDGIRSISQLRRPMPAGWSCMRISTRTPAGGAGRRRRIGTTCSGVTATRRIRMHGTG